MRAIEPPHTGREMSPDRQLFINRIMNKAIVEVDEEGTVVAAVTSGGDMTEGAAFVDRFSFVADRPFFFAISDDRTGAVLFMGAVYEPDE